MTIKRNGGLWFWRIGRIGGSFYVSRKVSTTRNEWLLAIHEDRFMLASMSIAGTLLTYVAAAY